MACLALHVIEPDRPHDNITGRMRFTSWIPKATNTHSEYIILIAFHGNNGYANEPQCNVIRILSVFLVNAGNNRVATLICQQFA